MSRRFLHTFLAVIAALLTAIASAQAQPPTEEEESPLAPARTDSPRTTLYSFVDAVNQIADAFVDLRATGETDIDIPWEVSKAFSTLDNSEFPDYTRLQETRFTALELAEIFGRIELPEYEEVPGPEDSELPEKWVIPGTEIAIERIREGPRAGEFLFSARSLARIPDYYQRVKDLPYRDARYEEIFRHLRYEPRAPWMRSVVRELPLWTRVNLLGLTLWQWFFYLGSIALGLLIWFLGFRLGYRGRSFDPNHQRFRFLASVLFPIAAMPVPLLVLSFVDILAIPYQLYLATRLFLNIVFMIGAMFVVLGVGYRLVEILASSSRTEKLSLNPLLIRLFGRLLTIAAAMVVLIEGCNNLGIPMTTLLAGAGVSGIALALGAQDAIRNLVGSMMVLLDKPFTVGERVLVKEFDGVVEDIGIRSTRLRLLNGHQATIPNEEMARTPIENVGRRPFIRKSFEFPLALNTAPDTVAKAAAILRESLSDHEGQSPDYPPRVLVDGPSRDCINLRALAWYHPPAYWDSCAWVEATSLAILQRFESEGIRLTPPSRELTVHNTPFPETRA